MRDTHSSAPSPAPPAGLAILYVDDEPTSRKLFARSFCDELPAIAAA